MDQFQNGTARARQKVPYLKLVYSAPEGEPAACSWMFTSADLIALTNWPHEAHGFSRMTIETGAATAAADGSYALLYAPERTWASWGLTRQDGEVVAWHCGSGIDAGRFSSMRAALATLPALSRPAETSAAVKRNSGYNPRVLAKKREGRRTTGASMLKTVFSAVVLAGIMALPYPASAKGCLKGAAVGGVAGHVAGHHGVLGAAAGCAVGHHEAAKNAKQDQDKGQQQAKSSPK